MKLTWKDLIIIGLGAIIILLATFKLIDFMYIKDKDIEVAVVGFIGTIIGGTLSGAITLLGVNKTLHEQRRKEEIRSLELKYYALQEYILELEEIRTEIGKLNVNIDKFYKTVNHYGKNITNDMVIKAVRKTSAKIHGLRKNKEFIRKIEGLGYELYSRELSFLKDLDTLVLALIAVRIDILSSPELYIVAHKNIGNVIDIGNEKNEELHKLKLEVRKEIRNF